ncbi:MAG: murein biosynthesis integral membrane protein MurJ [Proteobacteria bacterium]|nr:murein biosynthesis integral membrane protein MurJ [Pseudomonadota bacterium]
MQSEHANISRRVGTVSFFTFLSRILGLVRDAVLAWAFGATRFADAFYVAFRIPNLLRRLVAEGALTVAFVPVYTENLRISRAEGRRAASVVFTYLSIFLVALAIFGVIFAPLLVKMIAWGFADNPEKFEITVYLTRLMFPYIVLISLVALAMGILNSLKHFAAPAASPVLLNIFIIIGALVLERYARVPAEGVAIGVLLGGVAQLALQIPVLVRERMLPRIEFNWRHPALKGLLVLMIPSAFGAAVYQFNVVVVTFLASFLPDGSVSYLWYADRVSEFSLGIFSIAVATATLPTLSEHAAKKDIGSFKSTLGYSLRLAFLIDIPAAVGLYVLALPVISVLFQRGEFTPEAAVASAGALCFFAMKIPFVSGVRNLVPAFFALKDARTPVAVSVLAVAVNAAFALLLMKHLAHRGLAAALVISSAANFFLLLWMFRRKVGLIGCSAILKSVARTALASAVMGAALYAALNFIGFDRSLSIWARAGMLLALIFGGAALYLAIIRAISPEEFAAVAALVRRRAAGALPADRVPPSMP